METLKIVLPVFLIILAGYAGRRLEIVKHEWIPVLNGFVYYIALPAIILISFWQIDWADKGILPLAGFNLLVLAIFFAILFVAMYYNKYPKKTAAAFILASLVGNTIYMGFPIVGAIAKQNYSGMVASATVHLALGLVLAILVVEYMVVKSRQFKSYFFDLIKNPLIISMALGLVLSIFKSNNFFISQIQKPIAMLGATASPVALFSLGAFFKGKFVRSHLKLSLIATSIKLLLFPIAMILLARWAGFDKEQIAISGLLSGMPLAVTAFVISEKYKLDQAFVANTILISAIASIVTISIFLTVLVF
jgi:predicted permease